MRTVHACMLLGVVAFTVVTPQAWGEQDPSAMPALSQEVMSVLDKKSRELGAALAGDPVILQATRDSNTKNAALSVEKILQLDAQWRAGGLEDLVRTLVTNPCAQQLVAFQDDHNGYAELFIADAVGLNVCQTNRTSDYYQADEAWWVRGYRDGLGETYYGKIEYDESAMSEAIPVYLPIMDPQTHKAIGVMKAVVDLTAIKREL